MAADFWASTQWKHMHANAAVVPVAERARERIVLKDGKVLDPEEIQCILMNLAKYIFRCVHCLKLRVRVAATAVTYMKRFYMRLSMRDHHPLVVAPTCILLASKVEESNVQPKWILDVWRKPFGFRRPEHESEIVQCECHLLSGINDSLVIFHPYRPLQAFLQDAAVADECTSSAWKMVNDSYMSDVGMRHPPFVVALGCMYMASVMVGSDMRSWFAETNVDESQVAEVMNEMLRMYEMMNSKEVFDKRFGTAMRKLDASIPTHRAISPPLCGATTRSHR